jgi:hypothetical protein
MGHSLRAAQWWSLSDDLTRHFGSPEFQLIGPGRAQGETEQSRLEPLELQRFPHNQGLQRGEEQWPCGIPLAIGVMSNTRTEAKIRLYERVFGAPAGVYFLYNAKTGLTEG